MKKVILSLSLLLIFSLLTGCGAKSTPQVNIDQSIVTKTDSGIYQGQVDNNFIEIKISGVSDDKAFRVLMLSEDVKNKFEQLKLSKDDTVKFNYFENKNNQLVVTDISKI